MSKNFIYFIMELIAIISLGGSLYAYNESRIVGWGLIVLGVILLHIVRYKENPIIMSIPRKEEKIR